MGEEVEVGKEVVEELVVEVVGRKGPVALMVTALPQIQLAPSLVSASANVTSQGILNAGG